MRTVEYENLAKLNQTFFADYQNQFAKVMTSGWYILGKEVEQFEGKFAAYQETQHCIGVASGLDALVLALIALDLPAKSEVIVAANAYVACILSIIKAGHIPVLVEPSALHSNIDVEKIEAKITANTRVIMPVHLYGYPCDMHTISELAKKYNLHIIEDCAQAHGAAIKNKKMGQFSTISAFSFYPTKNLGALGDAGAVLTNDDSLAKKLRALRHYGSHIKYQNDYIGLNSRLDEIQASFLQVKLQKLDEINEHKRHLAKIYDTLLPNYYQKPQHHVDYYGVYHIYNIYCDRRDELREFLKQHGVITEIHYPIPPYRQKAFARMFDTEAYPVSDKLHSTTLSLPISYFHTPEDIQYVCDVMHQFATKVAL